MNYKKTHTHSVTGLVRFEVFFLNLYSNYLQRNFEAGLKNEIISRKKVLANSVRQLYGGLIKALVTLVIVNFINSGGGICYVIIFRLEYFVLL